MPKIKNEILTSQAPTEILLSGSGGIKQYFTEFSLNFREGEWSSSQIVNYKINVNLIF